MDNFLRVVKNTRDIKKQNCLKELGELVNKLRSTSTNGIIVSDRNMRKVVRLPNKESFTTILRADGSIDDCMSDDVNFRIDCLLDLWKLKETRMPYVNAAEMDSDDEDIVALSEISEICAWHFVSFGIQLVAASCLGHLSWMRALLRVGADPNEAIISDTRHTSLTAFRGCSDYAPVETRVEGLKLLIANRCRESKNDVRRWYTPSQLFENGSTDILQWLNISDFGTEFITDLQRVAYLCDHERMKVSTCTCLYRIVCLEWTGFRSLRAEWIYQKPTGCNRLSLCVA